MNKSIKTISLMVLLVIFLSAIVYASDKLEKDYSKVDPVDAGKNLPDTPTDTAKIFESKYLKLLKIRDNAFKNLLEKYLKISQEVIDGYKKIFGAGADGALERDIPGLEFYMAHIRKRLEIFEAGETPPAVEIEKAKKAKAEEGLIEITNIETSADETKTHVFITASGEIDISGDTYASSRGESVYYITNAKLAADLYSVLIDEDSIFRDITVTDDISMTKTLWGAILGTVPDENVVFLTFNNKDDKLEISQAPSEDAEDKNKLVLTFTHPEKKAEAPIAAEGKECIVDAEPNECGGELFCFPYYPKVYKEPEKKVELGLCLQSESVSHGSISDEGSCTHYSQCRNRICVDNKCLSAPEKPTEGMDCDPENNLCEKDLVCGRTHKICLKQSHVSKNLKVGDACSFSVTCVNNREQNPELSPEKQTDCNHHPELRKPGQREGGTCQLPQDIGASCLGNVHCKYNSEHNPDLPINQQTSCNENFAFSIYHTKGGECQLLQGAEGPCSADTDCKSKVCTGGMDGKCVGEKPKAPPPTPSAIEGRLCMEGDEYYKCVGGLTCDSDPLDEIIDSGDNEAIYDLSMKSSQSVSEKYRFNFELNKFKWRFAGGDWDELVIPEFDLDEKHSKFFEWYGNKKLAEITPEMGICVKKGVDLPLGSACKQDGICNGNDLVMGDRTATCNWHPAHHLSNQIAGGSCRELQQDEKPCSKHKDCISGECRTVVGEGDTTIDNFYTCKPGKKVEAAITIDKLTSREENGQTIIEVTLSEPGFEVEYVGAARTGGLKIKHKTKPVIRSDDVESATDVDLPHADRVVFDDAITLKETGLKVGFLTVVYPRLKIVDDPKVVPDGNVVRLIFSTKPEIPAITIDNLVSREENGQTIVEVTLSEPGVTAEYVPGKASGALKIKHKTKPIKKGGKLKSINTVTLPHARSIVIKEGQILTETGLEIGVVSLIYPSGTTVAKPEQPTIEGNVVRLTFAPLTGWEGLAAPAKLKITDIKPEVTPEGITRLIITSDTQIAEFLETNKLDENIKSHFKIDPMSERNPIIEFLIPHYMAEKQPYKKLFKKIYIGSGIQKSEEISLIEVRSETKDDIQSIELIQIDREYDKVIESADVTVDGNRIIITFRPPAAPVEEVKPEAPPPELTKITKIDIAKKGKNTIITIEGDKEFSAPDDSFSKDKKSWQAELFDAVYKDGKDTTISNDVNPFGDIVVEHKPGNSLILTSNLKTQPPEVLKRDPQEKKFIVTFGPPAKDGEEGDNCNEKQGLFCSADLKCQRNSICIKDQKDIPFGSYCRVDNDCGPCNTVDKRSKKKVCKTNPTLSCNTHPIYRKSFDSNPSGKCMPLQAQSGYCGLTGPRNVPENRDCIDKSCSKKKVCVDLRKDPSSNSYSQPCEDDKYCAKILRTNTRNAKCIEVGMCTKSGQEIIDLPACLRGKTTETNTETIIACSPRIEEKDNEINIVIQANGKIKVPARNIFEVKITQQDMDLLKTNTFSNRKFQNFTELHRPELGDLKRIFNLRDGLSISDYTLSNVVSTDRWKGDAEKTMNFVLDNVKLYTLNFKNKKFVESIKYYQLYSDLHIFITQAPNSPEMISDYDTVGNTFTITLKPKSAALLDLKTNFPIDHSGLSEKYSIPARETG
ncbi:hypothetical protein ACFL0W_04725 [Nanoarchaeota archaeon]